MKIKHKILSLNANIGVAEAYLEEGAFCAQEEKV